MLAPSYGASAESLSLIKGVPAITTTEVGKRLGLIVSEALLRKIGVEPLHRTGNAVYWREADMPVIRGLLAVFIEVGEEELARQIKGA